MRLRKRIKDILTEYIPDVPMAEIDAEKFIDALIAELNYMPAKKFIAVDNTRIRIDSIDHYYPFDRAGDDPIQFHVNITTTAGKKMKMSFNTAEERDERLKDIDLYVGV